MQGPDLLTMNTVHYQSGTDEWATPAYLFELLDREFRFTLDPCATAENTKHFRFFTREQDGIRQCWARERVYMNPPYGRVIGRWTAKARQEAARTVGAATVVGLIPARTDTEWWHRDVMKAAEIRFLRHRVRFAGATFVAPFPCAVVVWRAGARGPIVSTMHHRPAVS